MCETIKINNTGIGYGVARFTGLVLLKIFDTLVAWASSGQVFYDTRDFDFVKELEQNWEAIRKECVEVLNNTKVPNIQDFFREQSKITTDENWKSYLLLFFGYELEEHCRNCPETTKLVKAIPGVSSAMFSVLAPGKKLLPHKGVYKGVLRYHLGLIIPENEKQSWLVVNGVKKNWLEGKSLIFDDTFMHEACNESNQIRVVLFLDVVRTLPFPLNYVNKAIFKLMKGSPFIQNVIKESKRLEMLTIREFKVGFSY